VSVGRGKSAGKKKKGRKKETRSVQEGGESRNEEEREEKTSKKKDPHFLSRVEKEELFLLKGNERSVKEKALPQIRKK